MFWHHIQTGVNKLPCTVSRTSFRKLF